MTVPAFVAVGSNLDPARNVCRALELLAGRTHVVAVSTVYRTPAEGRPEQPPFYNCVVRIETDLPARELKHQVLRGIEEELGRRRGPDKYAPRPIDLDLIAYDQMAIQAEGLVLPDPDISRRAFIAVPLAELEPTLVLPGANSNMAAMAAALPREGLTPLKSFTAAMREGTGHGR